MRGFVSLSFCYFLVAALLVGCATSPGRFSDSPDSLDEGAFASLIGPLRPQRLLQGECGLFLWERSEQRDLVFFGKGKQAEGRMQVAGQEVTFERIAAEGDAMFGQYPIQTYRRGDLKVQLTMDFEARANMAGGVVVPRASLRFEQTGGWHLVMPVGGMVACQPG